MSDQNALLAAIVEHPDEDIPRLMLADWLDEHGGPTDRARAQFIRAQCELARGCGQCRPDRTIFLLGPYDPLGADVPPNGYVEPCPRCGSAGELKIKVHELRTDHEAAWRAAGPCPKCGGTGRIRVGGGGGGTDPCRDCNDSKDRGGLLERFAYSDNGYLEETPRNRYESVRIRWDRGFPDVLRVPRLSDCIHRRCPGCGGMAELGEFITCRCSHAHNPENVPTPWLLRVVRNHPTVTGVIPLDRRPLRLHRDDKSVYFRWYDGRRVGGEYPFDGQRARLPNDLWDAYVLRHGDVEHPTEEDATGALGRVLVDLSRATPL